MQRTKDNNAVDIQYQKTCLYQIVLLKT